MRWMAFGLALWLMGCGPASEPPASPTPPVQGTPAAPALSYAFHLKGSDFAVSDGPRIEAEGKSYTVKVEDDRIKVFDATNTVQVKVKRSKDGGLTLEDGAEKRVLRLKGKSRDGFEGEDASGHRLFRAKWHDGWDLEQGRVTVTGQTVSLGSQKLEGTDRPDAGLALAAPSLTPVQKAALAVFLIQIGL